MLEHDKGIVLILVVVSVSSLAILGLSLVCLAPSSRTLEEATAEEHSKYFIRIYFLLELTVAESATAPPWRLHVARFLPSLIVDFAFLPIGEADVGSADFLESLTGLRRLVLVRMQLYGVLFVRLLYLVLACVARHTQYVVIVLLC